MMPSPSSPAVTCADCAEHESGGQAAQALSRRGLLAGAAAAGSAIALSEHLSIRTADAATAATADTLVVLSLRGGFDGLSAVVPASDPLYYTARPTIAVPAATTLRLDSRFGLHPALGPLLPLWQNKSLAIVQAAGLINPNRSHFSAMEEVERATPSSGLRTGWLDRAVGLSPIPRQAPFRSTSFGNQPPRSTLGSEPTVGLRAIKDFRLWSADSVTDRARWTALLRQFSKNASPPVAETTQSTLAALSAAAELSKSGYVPTPTTPYPKTDLGRALADAAQLIKSPQPISVITVDLGNWDMHSGLGPADAGWMFDNLTELSTALAAFASDLGSALKQVTLVTLSEFGRRVQENGSGGVDHGWGNTMFVLGGGVNGGVVYGSWPGLSVASLVEGDLAVRTDYRDVLADIVVNRCGGSLAQARTIFPGWLGTPTAVTKAR
jgi:uncharacterized protein (DUF1501 family)